MHYLTTQCSHEIDIDTISGYFSLHMESTRDYYVRHRLDILK